MLWRVIIGETAYVQLFKRRWLPGATEHLIGAFRDSGGWDIIHVRDFMTVKLT